MNKSSYINELQKYKKECVLAKHGKHVGWFLIKKAKSNLYYCILVAINIAMWLLSKPVEELELLPNKELSNLVDQATNVYFLTHDKSAESIFSSNIDTWKNIGNVQFIDRVGQCFSAMNT